MHSIYMVLATLHTGVTLHENAVGHVPDPDLSHKEGVLEHAIICVCVAAWRWHTAAWRWHTAAALTPQTHLSHGAAPEHAILCVCCCVEMAHSCVEMANSCGIDPSNAPQPRCCT
jgi:hypothetical protein